MESTCPDPSSSCNYHEVLVTQWDWIVDVDFSSKKLLCAITIDATSMKDGASVLVLDTCDLAISSVVNAESGEPLQYQLKSDVEGAFGTPLFITLPSSSAVKGGEVKVKICYETSPTCMAVQWLEKAQTAGKDHPYLFTQCQPIHARSMIPCQDTPAVKTTYTTDVAVPRELTALMSAKRQGSVPHLSDSSKTVFKFHQMIPISSYLVALVVGALESRKIGPRTSVWSEKELVEQAAWEFEDTEKMLCAAEEVAGKYVWGQYDILVPPPSFPYGGMENPCLTFVSTTLLAGDRSLANVIAHEISHSWTGNLVTNESWEEFWLNEGITTFIERRILSKLLGEKERHLQAIDGWNDLKNAVARFEDRPHLTALVPMLTGVHPDDAYSVIPYEKGHAFLFYLETLLGGPGALDSFLKSYVQKYKYRTINSVEWKEFFLEYFNKEVSEGVLDEVEWDKWFYDPGMPPCTPKYDTSVTDASAELAEKWANAELSTEDLSQFSEDDLKDMSSKTVQHFLNQLLEKSNLSVEKLQAMDQKYGLGKRENAEIKFRWLKLCLVCKDKAAFPVVTDFVTKQGRMKYVRPLYKALYGCDEDGKRLAVSTFVANKQFYHSVAAGLLEKDLALSESS